MTDLRDFIEQQAALGRVVRIADPLDPVAEAGAALAAHEGRIVILEQVRGYDTPVIGGVVSSRTLMAAAIGARPEQAVPRLAAAMDQPRPCRTVTDAPFLDDPISTTDVGSVVPLLTFDPGADRPYTTSTIVAARSPQHGMNLSFHRMMYLGDNRFSVRIVPRHLRAILGEGGGVAEVAVLVGVHPAISLAAATSGAPDFDELELASALLPAGLDVVDLDGLDVPAGCELVLRGTIGQQRAEEGPFVDLTGTLDGTRQQPVLEVTRIYRRPGLCYHTIVPGGQEHQLLMGTPQEPRMLRAVGNAVPCLHDLALSGGGCHWLHAVVALRQPLAGQARNAAMAALGAHPSLKRVVVVDDDVDIHDAAAVEWAIATRVQPDRDVIILPGCRGSSLDPSRDPADSTTAKWLIDATIPPGADRGEFVRPGDGG
jgi:2,5-furandicarboxylate decarboxylase 1